MRGLVKLTLAVAVSWMATGCGRNVPVSLTHSSVLAKAGLESYWQRKLDLLEGEKIVRLFRIQENLYGLTDTNHLIAVDAATGNRKWVRQIAEPGVCIYPPCHGDDVAMRPKMPGVAQVLVKEAPGLLKTYDLVLINTPDYALAFDRNTGDLMRKIGFDSRPDEFAANTGGSCDGTYYYVGAAGGRCYAIRVNEGVIAWYLPTEEMITAAPKAHSPGGAGRVFIAGGDAQLHIAKAGPFLTMVWPPKGTRKWPDMAGPVITEMHVDDRACFVPCVSQRLYAFSLAGGEPIWRFTTAGRLMDPVQVSTNSVFQYARADKLYAVNPANGKLRWSLPEGRRVLASMPVAGAPTTYLLDESIHLLIIDEILGKVRASIPLTGCDLFADNTSASAIYVGNSDGRLYCLRQLGAAHLTAEELRKAK